MELVLQTPGGKAPQSLTIKMIVHYTICNNRGMELELQTPLSTTIVLPVSHTNMRHMFVYTTERINMHRSYCVKYPRNVIFKIKYYMDTVDFMIPIDNFIATHRSCKFNDDQIIEKTITHYCYYQKRETDPLRYYRKSLIIDKPNIKDVNGENIYKLSWSHMKTKNQFRWIKCESIYVGPVLIVNKWITYDGKDVKLNAIIRQ